MSMRLIRRMDGVRRVDFQVTFAMGFEEFVDALAAYHLVYVGEFPEKPSRKQLLDAVRDHLRRKGWNFWWTDGLDEDEVKEARDWAVAQVRRALPEIPEDEPDYRKLR